LQDQLLEEVGLAIVKTECVVLTTGAELGCYHSLCIHSGRIASWSDNLIHHDTAIFEQGQEEIC
jgi:hypothetical protein